MTARTVLVPLLRENVAPRFDLAVELLVVGLDEGRNETSRQHVMLAHSSADELCDFILRQGVSAVIVGGIEEEYFHYLRWKRVEILDGVMGPADLALARFARGELAPGDVLFERSEDCGA
ncbi:MAG: NifB/NifX family molybdenum-iron cluster-binding protein [Thermodesulfobacteriota bacterium]